MISSSGDAADIWQTITTFYSGSIYPSYVLYKGFMSVYPYVWLYQLSLLLHCNEFLFVMIYHALLFSYITVIGIPQLITHFTGYNAKLWQRLLLIGTLFLFWKPTYALNCLMVDLPSCAVFIAACNCSVKAGKTDRYPRKLFLFLTGLLSALCAGISGQYSVSFLCIILYSLVKLSPFSSLKKRETRADFFLSLLCLFAGTVLVKAESIHFQVTVLDSLRANGTWIADGNAWLRRGLVFMLDKNRMFFGWQLNNERGRAILDSYFGGTNNAAEILQQAAIGQYGWIIPEYLKAFFRYPIDFIVGYVDRLFICLSTDMARNSFIGLSFGYTLLYLTIYTFIPRLRRIKDVFCSNFWLVAGFLSSIIPCLVLTVEMRYALSLQAFIYGIAILGPVVPNIGSVIARNISDCFFSKRGCRIKEKNFPWGFVLWLVFILCCLAHMGTLYAQSDLGIEMLFKWL